MPDSTLRVLVFEDSPTDELLLREALAQDALTAFELRVVERLSDGWPLLGTGGFDVVLLDLGLPDSQGLATFQRVHAAVPDMPIVVCSGNADEHDAILAVRAGAQDYVVKGPVGFAMTGRAVRHAMERQKLHQSLLDSERRFSTAFHSSPACQIITTVPDGLILDANAAFCHLLDYERAALIGHTTSELGIWAFADDRTAALQAFLADGRISNREAIYRTRGGEHRTVIASVESIDIKGLPCVISTSVDITDRKRAEEALRLSEERHRQVSSRISDYVYSGRVRPDGSATTDWISGAFERITGYTTEEINQLPLGFASLVLPDDLAPIVAWQPVLREQRTATVEYRLRCKDGSLRWLRDYMRIESGAESDQDLHLIGAVQDITERKQAEDKLRESERRFSTIFHSSPISIILTRIADGCIIDANAALLKLFGYGRDEVLGRTTSELGMFAQPDDRAHLISTLAEHGRLQDIEMCYRKRSGEIGQLLLAAEPLDLAGENYLVCMLSDITARKQAEAEIHQLNAELETRVATRTHELAAANESLAAAVDRLQDLDRLKSKLVSDVSHELRTPITSLSLYIDLLEHGKPEKRDLYVSKLKEQMARLHKLIDDILDMSRLERDTTGIGRSPVDLNAIAEHVSAMERGAAEAAGLTLTCDTTDHLPPVVARPDQLTRAITNLVSNAIKYTSTGAVRVQTRQDTQRVCVEVSDTGLGIPADELPHLFERFYRGRNVAQSSIPGTGLGLSIVKEIIESHGGTVEVASVIGQGSTFRAWLPVAG